MKVVSNIAELRALLGKWVGNSSSIGFVPTMGALHTGHLSLISRSIKENDKTCVSIFVNPKQFSPDEDFDIYPRDLDQDILTLDGAKVDLLYVPRLEEMYKPGSLTVITVPVIGDILEGVYRKNFFSGVATVVAKLLIQVGPHRLYLGEKDYQQLCVIRQMVDDLDISTDILACATIREKDGLAISSRNVRLSDRQREVAPLLHQTLLEAAEAFDNTGDELVTAENSTRKLLERGFDKVDYFSICDGLTLGAIGPKTENIRILAAAWLGNNRLIDNIAISTILTRTAGGNNN